MSSRFDRVAAPNPDNAIKLMFGSLVAIAFIAQILGIDVRGASPL
jgi:hypothetical protein